tara:strand:- start:22 stop:735 length:714 start_codon:yes stop_codon:yes gene_type:complete
MRVPAYDPLAISEHAVGMMLALNRHLCASRDRVRAGNFTLDGLVGNSLREKTVGVVGTGKIGRGFAKICGDGFGMRVLGYDKFEKDDFRGEYVSLDELLRESDVVSLHVPLTPETRGLIKKETIEKMKFGAMLINTSRGALVDARAAIDALYEGRLGALGLDVYEHENRLFFKDFSSMDTSRRMMMWDDGDVPGRLTFHTTPDGSTTPAERSTIRHIRSRPNRVLSVRKLFTRRWRF